MKRIILATLAVSAFGQSAFEVVSIKPAPPGVRNMGIGRGPGGGMNAYNVPLKFLITYAYDVRDFQVSGGPGWADSERYDVSAKPESRASQEQLKLMLQTLLADRFKLVLHRETRQLPVYELIVGKGGPKLKESAEGASPSLLTDGKSITASKVTMPMFIRLLSQLLGRSVLDKTGLAGNYDFKLEWTPDEAEGDGPSVFTAIQEQLGLKLDSQKGPVETLVIDHAEKPTEN
jgi:uncharacterized protein (TIGR03435 family)